MKYKVKFSECSGNEIVEAEQVKLGNDCHFPYGNQLMYKFENGQWYVEHFERKSYWFEVHDGDWIILEGKRKHDKWPNDNFQRALEN